MGLTLSLILRTQKQPLYISLVAMWRESTDANLNFRNPDFMLFSAFSAVLFRATNNDFYPGNI